MALYAQLRLEPHIGVHVGEDRRVGDRLDEAGAEIGRRNAEDHVVVPALSAHRISRRSEIRLTDIALACVGATGHDEEVMHAAVAQSIGLHEARLTDGTVRGDEPRDEIPGAIGARDVNQRILWRATASDSRVQVTRRALIRVEAWTESVVCSPRDHFDLGKASESILKIA